jgi:hypothetical protein
MTELTPSLKRQLKKQLIAASETPYDKAIKLKVKLAKSKTHKMKLSYASKIHLEPLTLVQLYPKTFKIHDNHIMFQEIANVQ